jgi:heat shock protein HslJ
MKKIRDAKSPHYAIKILCLILLAVCIWLPGCMLNGNTQPPPVLTGHEWNLQGYRDSNGELVSPIPGSTIAITFDPSGDLSGRSGCNSYHGSYTVEGEILTIRSLASTKMYCSEPEGLMAQEERYLSLLSDSTRYQILDGNLVLSYYDVRKNLVYK